MICRHSIPRNSPVRLSGWMPDEARTKGMLMAEKKVNPILKQVLELGPPLVFFGIYMWIKDDTFTIGGTEYSGFIVAAVLLVPVLLGAIAVLWFLTGRLSRLQVFTAVAVIFFGGLTLWFNDERFFKMKTTLVYGSFALILGVGLMRGRSGLQWVMGDMLPMRHEGWMILTRRLTFLCAALAIANEIIWRTQSNETWVWIETFAFPVVTFIFIAAQIATLDRYMIESEEKDQG